MGWHDIQVYIENEGIPHEQFNEIVHGMLESIRWLDNHYAMEIKKKNAEIAALKKQLGDIGRELD